MLCIDFTKLDKAESGKDDVLVMVDAYSKYTLAIVTKDQTAKTISRVLIEQWIRKYGTPERLHSNQGANFLSQVIQEICKEYGIKKSQTTPYHPKGNGIVERANRTI